MRLSENEIINAAEAEFNEHPQAEWADIYKYFLQSLYGPGHLILNRQKAEENLREELKTLDNEYPLEIQKLLPEENFYRVSLSFVGREKIPFTDFLQSFVISADRACFLREQWLKDWQEIEKIIKLRYEKFLKGKIVLPDNLLISHSESYRQRYKPHYRLIARTEFEILIKRHAL